MQHYSRCLLSTLCLICLSTSVVADSIFPTAIKKLPPDGSEKLFPEHLAFAPLPALSPREAAAAAISFLEAQDDEFCQLNGTSRIHRPAFALHYDQSESHVLRRVVKALSLFDRREACPSGMNSCSSIGASNKCCQEGTYCVGVSDPSVGQVACCPDGATCGGGVGNCPSDATGCAAELGGGCCIPGYICQGAGCVPSASATSTQTTVQTSVQNQEPSTITTTQTTIIGGTPSTVIVTLTVTQTPSIQPTTLTSVETVTVSDGKTVTGAPPYRPISSSTETEPSGTTENSDTQTGCPTGFYGCLATHGGGCCQTDRDCSTSSCPLPSTTIITDGRTVVVLATDVPAAAASSTCADGWSLCGESAGPIPGCCPTGYSCGTASCFTSLASATAEVQKKFPKANSARIQAPCLMFLAVALTLPLIAFC